jgi:tRNA pseudouridine55 synthase
MPRFRGSVIGGEQIDGLLVVDKPGGWTSHDVVARVRRLTGERRAGHAGTLDPMATGVLPLGLGQGTRVLEYLSEAGKAYRAGVRLGISTNTYDAEGEVTAEASPAGISRSQIEQALLPFRGTFEQRPPLFSALKRHGTPLYRYARAGVEVDVPARTARLDDLRICAYDPPDLELEIECASGFYVRSLAHDLGQALGCGAHLQALVRTRAGPFTLADAVGIEALAQAAEAKRLTSLLWSMDAPLRGRPAVILAKEHADDLVNGKTLSLTPPPVAPSGGVCRAYSTDGELIGLVKLAEDGTARPVKIFPAGRRGPNLEFDEFTSFPIP